MATIKVYYPGGRLASYRVNAEIQEGAPFRDPDTGEVGRVVGRMES